VDLHQETTKTALTRWLGRFAHYNELPRQIQQMEEVIRRLECQARTETLQQQTRAHIEDMVLRLRSGISVSNTEAPLDFPLPPPLDRTLPLDDRLVALMALNDETRNPRQRIGPTKNILYGEVCRNVRGLTEEHLPRLKAYVETAQREIAAAQVAPS